MEKNELIDELYKKYYKYLLYIAKQTVPEAEADADDIVQNVFLNLMKSPDWLAQCVLKSDHPDELRCILRTFLRNACYKYYRRLKVMHNIFIDVSDCDLFAISTDVERKYDNKNLFEHVINILDELNERSKDLILKYYVYGYSIDELAEQTGLSPRTIETYIYQALKYIRGNF